MSFQFHPYAIVLFISALTTLLTTIIVLRRDLPDSRVLGATLSGSFIWSLAYALSWSLSTLEEKLAWLRIAYFGVVTVPTLFLIFALRITHYENLLTPRTLGLLSIEPLFVLVLIWAQPNVFFSEIALEQRNGFEVLHLGRGIGHWISTLYSYLIILLALVVLAVSAWRANAFFRRQYLVILAAAVVPFVASVFTQLSYRQLADLDVAPISFAISGILFVYAMFYYQFMDLLPIARGRLIESMSDGVLVLDAQGRIVDVNPAMENFLEEEPSALLGREFIGILRVWAYNADQLLDGSDTHAEIRLPHKPSQHVDLRVTPLYDDHQKLSGRLIVFRDVTDRKEVERDLRHAMDRLQTQLIEIGLLQSKLREQAIRDALTNVFNRRYLEDTLEREIARAQREGYPLCAIMMDLDFFKEVNDTYGHEAGDLVLKTLAETVKRQSRHGDFVCRYGGEEFVLVMPNIGIETARQRVENLHQIIDAMNIPYGVFNLTTTISMGVAMYPDHGKTKEELLRAADRAMYTAKNTGRNRVVFCPEPELSKD